MVYQREKRIGVCLGRTWKNQSHFVANLCSGRVCVDERTIVQHQTSYLNHKLPLSGKRQTVTGPFFEVFYDGVGLGAPELFFPPNMGLSLECDIFWSRLG